MKSNTTRRSQPITRSRLRKPTSKSITTVLWPRMASPAAIAAEVVVLPTPPLPEVTTMTCPGFLLAMLAKRPSSSSPTDTGAGSAQARQNAQLIVDERDLRRLLVIFRRDRFADEIAPGDADQLGLEAMREDARVDIARGAGDGAAAQGPIDVDMAVGYHLGAGAHWRQHDEIAATRVDLRARAHRLRHESRLPGRAILAGAVLGAFSARASAAAGSHAEDREAGRRGEAALHGARVLHADRDQAMLAQELLQRLEIGLGNAAEAVPEIDHRRRPREEARTQRHLLGDLALERGVVRIYDPHHHDGEDRALQPVGHHPTSTSPSATCGTREATSTASRKRSRSFYEATRKFLACIRALARLARRAPLTATSLPAAATSGSPPHCRRS